MDVSEDLYVFITTDPEIVDLHRQWTDAYKAFGTQIRELSETLLPGQERSPIIRNGFGDTHLCGFSAEGGVPDGWRSIDTGRGPGFIYPNKRSKVGKQMAQRIDALVYKDPRRQLPGMPSEKWVPNERGDGSFRVISPSIRVIDGTMFVVWRADPRKDDAMGNPNVDTSIWEPCLLSKYYTATEAADDVQEINA